ncbi:hypothetical protein Tco_0564860 [Tanacetum coccineum]
MLDKDLYDSWKSIMELYMQNKEHERMILESVENGPFIWPTVEENRVTRTKKYAELSAAEKIQADCNMKATNIILQGLPADIYSLVNHHRVSKDLWERVQLLMQDYAVDSAMVVKVLNCQGRATRKFLVDPRSSRWSSHSDNSSKNNDAFQTKDLDTYDSDCDDISNAKAVLMVNISNYGSDVILVVPHSETNLNAMENQSVHTMQDFEQSPVVGFYK